LQSRKLDHVEKPPKHLKRDGRKLWRELVEEYSITDAAGLALVTTAAECLDRMRAAQVAIEEHGEVVTDQIRPGESKSCGCTGEGFARWPAGCTQGVEFGF
jgi:phage terminase small subunit